MLPEYYKKYELAGLGATPVILETILTKSLDGLGWDDEIWDSRPNSERFTIRESLAHIAEWESIARGRIERTRDEDRPVLQNWDEDQAAIDGDYASKSPLDSFELYRAERRKTLEVLHALTTEQWFRIAVREGVGELRVDQQISLMMAHDIYHIEHAREILASH